MGRTSSRWAGAMTRACSAFACRRNATAQYALAIVSTSYVFRHVDPDRPARMVIRTALTDWRRTREPVTERRDPRLVARRIVVRGGIT